MGENELFKTLGRKLGISLPSTFRKANELQRLVHTKGMKSVTASCEAVICLQLAATLTSDTCDKSSAPKLAGLPASKYRSQYQAFSQMLGVQPRVFIHDLAISHGAMPAENLAKAVLAEYYKTVQGVDTQSSLCQSAALLAAAKQMKIKLDRKKLLDVSGAQKKVFDTLVEQLSEIAKKLYEAKSHITDTKSKTKTLMDIVEENLANDAENCSQKRKDKHNKGNNKRTKSDKEADDHEYELWKQKILEEAAANKA